MADIDTVLERLVTDTAFRDQLGTDPAAALAGYDLSTDDLQLLAGSLDTGDTAQRGVEQRTSKSAVLGLLASFAGGGGGGVKPPPLDGGSKDSAGFEELAPPDNDARTKHLGRPKFGDITLKRGVDSSGGDPTDLAPADDDATAAKLPGKPKPGEITLTRTAEPGAGEPDAWIKIGPELLGGSGASAGKGGSIVVMDPTNAAPAGGTDPEEPAAAFKQGFPVKWQGASVSGDGAADLDPNAAPGGVTGPGEPAAAFKQGFPIKWQGASVSGEDGADLDPNAAPGEGAEAQTTGSVPKKVEIGQMKAGDTSVAERTSTEDGGEFLTIEDA